MWWLSLRAFWFAFSAQGGDSKARGLQEAPGFLRFGCYLVLSFFAFSALETSVSGLGDRYDKGIFIADVDL